jgi:hypothetical protein
VIATDAGTITRVHGPGFSSPKTRVVSEPAQVPGRFYGPWAGPRIAGHMANYTSRSIN